MLSFKTVLSWKFLRCSHSENVTENDRPTLVNGDENTLAVLNTVEQKYVYNWTKQADWLYVELTIIR